MAKSTKRKRTRAAAAAWTPGSYSFAAAVRWTDATRSNLIHWTNTGIIKADVADTAGPGYPRRFSTLNLIEAQLAAMMNRFRIPTALIATGVQHLRNFHELCVAVRASAEQGTTDERRLSPDQRRAVKAAYLQQFLRRDAKDGDASDAAKRRYARKLTASKDVMFSAENEQLILHHATHWYRFTTDSAFRERHFYGLFVFPDEAAATIADEPIELAKVIQHQAIVINLAPVVAFYNMLGEHRPDLLW